MKRFKATVVREERVYTGKITLADLREKFNIPDSAQVTVTVPSGGDYSGDDITMGDDFQAINVTWTEVTK